MELDAAAAPDGATLSADVCIVGGGPAGLTLADALQSAGREVVLLESASRGAGPDLQELNAGEVTEPSYRDLRLCRARGVGGTANIWNTRFEDETFAKYLPLDAVDFEARDWIPGSGWPFTRATLDPCYERAHAVCGLGPFDYGTAKAGAPDRPPFDLAGSALVNGVYHFGPSAVFREIIPERLRASTTAMLVLGATVTALARSPGGGRVTEARWRTTAGRRGAVRAERFVLAAGGIENARLMLLFREDGASHPRTSEWLGRGFMEHPIDRSLVLASRAAEFSWAGFYAPHMAELGDMMGRIGLSAELLREHRLPNTTVRLDHGYEAPPRPLEEALRPKARRLVPWQSARRRIGNTIRAVAAIPARLSAPRYQLAIDLEQPPDRDMGVVLSDRRDAFGQRQATLRWRWRADDQRNRERILAVVEHELRRAGAGRVHSTAYIPLDPNAHHHSGTTRMHVDPSEGVVDEHLRVHGEENLFITGSSVFPTAGFANPTLTVIALTLRLGDRLVGAR